MRSTPARARSRCGSHAGGLELVEVTDDGCGMAPDEMRARAGAACDLEAARRCDRRGHELRLSRRGLAVDRQRARLTLESRVRGADGWRIEIDHGELVGEGPAALPPGTRVRVEGLFDKVPARRKFLRSPARGICRLPRCREAAGDGPPRCRLHASTMTGGGSLPSQPAEAAGAGRRAADRTNWTGTGSASTAHAKGVRLTGVVGLPTFNRGMADQQYPVRQRRGR